MDRVSTFWRFLNRYINFKIGSLAGLVIGSVVFVINVDYGFMPAFAGFWKQFAFNLLMAGVNTRTCERLVRGIDNRALSLFSAATIPTIQAFIVLYAVHYFGGTPYPGASTLWQAAANLIFFYFLALNYEGRIHVITNALPFVGKMLRIRDVAEDS